MSKKSRGINAERELIHKFWDEGWAAIRIAGSGSTKYPSPDLLVGNNIRKLSLEAKITTDKKKYFRKEEVEALQKFSKVFGSEPWIAIKFFRKKWRFLNPEDLEDTGKSFAISLEDSKFKGLLFEELIEEENYKD